MIMWCCYVVWQLFQTVFLKNVCNTSCTILFFLSFVVWLRWRWWRATVQLSNPLHILSAIFTLSEEVQETPRCTALYRPTLFSRVARNAPPQSVGSRWVIDFWQHQLLCDLKIAFALEPTLGEPLSRHISPRRMLFFFFKNCVLSENCFHARPQWDCGSMVFQCHCVDAAVHSCWMFKSSVF